MKKLFFLLALVSVFLSLSCVNQKKEIPIKKFKIQIEIEKILSKNPKRDFNSIYRNYFDSLFEKKIKLKISEGILDDIPLQLSSLKDLGNNNYSAHFHFYKWYNIEENVFLDKINIDVIALIKKERALTLKEENYYFVKGDFKTFLKDNYRDYIDGLCYSYDVKMTTDHYKGDEYTFGIILLDNALIKKYDY